MNRIVIPLVLVLIFSGIVGYYFINNQKSGGPIAIPSGGVCDKDTMTCSDGTVLNRQWPSCDFPPCPSGNESSPASTSAPTSPAPTASTKGNDITISGEMICLPHRDTSGPQTMECAFGLKGEDGKNYGLADPNWEFITNAVTGTKVRIKGKLQMKQDEKYNSVGTIVIEDLIKE